MGKRNRKQVRSRLLASVLTASMVFSMLPMGGALLASAEGGSSTPIRYEMEDLLADGKIAMHTLTPGDASEEVAVEATGTDANPSGGTYCNVRFYKEGNYITMTLDNIPETGLYRVTMAVKGNESSASAALAKDYGTGEAQVGTTFCPNGAAMQANSFGVDVPKATAEFELEAGTDTIDLVGMGWTSNSFRPDYIEIQQIPHESVFVDISDKVDEGTVSVTGADNPSASSDNSTPWGNKKLTWVNNAQQGSTFTVPVTVDYAGDYQVYFSYKARETSGDMTVAVDGTEVGTVDCYAEGNDGAGNRSARTRKCFEPLVGTVNIPEAGDVDVTFTFAEDTGAAQTFVPLAITLVPLFSDEEPEDPVVTIPDEVLHFDFADGANDASGNGNNGRPGSDVTIANGIATFAGGKNDKSVIVIDNPIAKRENLTVSAMVKVDSQPAEWATLWEAWSDDSTGGKLIRVSLQDKDTKNVFAQTRMLVDGSPKATKLDGGVQMPVGEWTEITFVAEGNTMRLYVNGKLLNEFSKPESVIAPSDLADAAKIYLGRDPQWNDNGLTGQMSDFRVYGEALTAEQVAAVYAENKQEVDPDLPPVEPGQPVLHYDFAADATDVAGDYDGTIVGEGVTIADGIAYFTGNADSDIEVPVAALKQENLTISMMVQTPSQPSTWTTLLEASAPGVDDCALMKFIARTGEDNGDAISMTVRGTDGAQVRITDKATQMPQKSWTELTYVQEGAVGRVYLNGRRIAERAELAFSPAQLPENGVVSLGGARYWDDPSFDGQMSDFRVYREALSDAQVEALYTENLAEVTFDLGEAPADGEARAVYDLVSALPDNITYKEGPAVREARKAYDALTAGQQDMLAADVLRKLTYAENALEAVYAAFTFRVTVGGMGGDTPYTFDRSPWLNAQRLRDEEKQQLADSLTEEVFYQYYNGYRVGQITGTRDVDNYSGMAGVQQEARPNDNLCSPWSTDRYWAYVTSPYLGMAFTTKGVFATQVYDYRGPISNAFAYDGRIYQVFDNRVESYSSDAVLQVGVNYSDPALQEEMGLDWQSVDNYPGKGASDQGPEDRYTFRYAYAKYNADHKWEGLVAGIPDGYMETLDLNAEGEDLAAAKIRYQHFIGPRGDAYIVTTQSVIDATPENSGSPIGAYVIIGEMARALLAQGEGVREALAVTGTPVGDAQTAADGAVTQKFINGTLYAKDGTYKFFTDEQTAAVNRLMADIRQAAGVPDGTTLESFQAAIAAAESAYAAMDEVLQASVTNYDTIDRLKNAVADIEAVEAMIAALPEPDTLTDKASVLAVMEPLEAAEAAVNGLDEVYRKLVPSLDKLAAVREMVLQNNVIAAENLIDAIGPLPEEDAYRLAKAVWDAKEAYDALPEEDRSDVDSDKAAALEQAVAAMEALWETYPAGRIDREETGRWDDSAWLTPWMNGSNFDDASRAAVWDAMEDEMAYQYMHEGYDLGFLTSSPNAVQMQEGLLYVELGDGTDGGDNIPGCNPWGQGGRQWAAVVAPYAGVAFSIKSPFGYLGTGNLVLLGNAFAYEGRVYLLTRSAVYSYDADSLPASREDITVENLFPGADAQGQDMTNGVFAYAAALYNQAEKWNNDTVGIPSGSTLLTEDGDTCYQVFEGPDGGACIVGDAAAVAAADANVPTEAAFVLDADDLAVLLAATGTENAGAALNQTGAPLTARPSGGAWTFAKGYITEGKL